MATQTLQIVEQDVTIRMRGDSRATSQPAPDHGQTNDIRKWVVLSAATAVVFVGVGFSNAFGGFVDYYQKVMFPDMPPSQLLLIGSFASSLYFVCGVFTGRVADLAGYQICLAIGSVLMVAALIAASFATEYYQLLLSQGVLFGLGNSFTYYPAVSITRQYFGSKQHGFASAVVVSGGALGGAIMPSVARTCIAQYGLAQTFRVLVYLAVGLLVPTVPLLRAKMDRRPAASRSKKLLDLSLLRNKSYVIMIVSTTIAMVGYLPRYFFLPTSAIERGVSGSYATALLAIMNALSIVGRLGIGMFSDRYGKILALEVSFIMCGVGHVLFWLPAVLVQGQEATTALFTLFVVYVGLLGSGFISLFPVVVSHLFGPQELASKMGLLNSIVGLGILAGPSAIYSIILADSWTLGIIITGVLMVAGGAAMTGMFRYSADS